MVNGTLIWSVSQTNAKTASQREKSFFLAVSATEWIAMNSAAPFLFHLQDSCPSFRCIVV
ncbi:hypothetical protein [Muribaculum intestinale]|uniref:hypothetical protein n=1 Tax=Muribaculum intestinale TaxID=1796646 RepID=UPI0024303CBC|nr:hypothetical protein [Muribaculum intestinale]